LRLINAMYGSQIRLDKYRVTIRKEKAKKYRKNKRNTRLTNASV